MQAISAALKEVNGLILVASMKIKFRKHIKKPLQVTDLKGFKDGAPEEIVKQVHRHAGVGRHPLYRHLEKLAGKPYGLSD